MTTQEWLKQELVNRGLWGDGIANEVLALIKADKSAQGVSWSCPIESYPDVLRPVLLLTAARHAVDWIDANKPQAFYRPIFAEMCGRN